MRILPVLSALLAVAVTFSARADQEASLKEHFKGALVDAAGQPVDLATLKGKAVGIYFSAHWCGPCRAFTPNLVKYRDEHKDAFEVVFVSSDHDAEAQASYMKEAGMKWPTLPLKGDVANALDAKYEVKGIPTLVILKSNGDLLTRDGRALIGTNPDANLLKDPAATIAVENYKCGKCDKIHQRSVLKVAKS
jgi:nucleoredoxin